MWWPWISLNGDGCVSSAVLWVGEFTWLLYVISVVPFSKVHRWLLLVLGWNNKISPRPNTILYFIPFYRWLKLLARAHLVHVLFAVDSFLKQTTLIIKKAWIIKEIKTCEKLHGFIFLRLEAEMCSGACHTLCMHFVFSYLFLRSLLLPALIPFSAQFLWLSS